jgi:hypothetical protein
MEKDQNKKQPIKTPQVEPEITQPNADIKPTPENAKEVTDTRTETLTDLQSQARREISTSNLAMITSGKSIDVETQKYLNEYFQGSIDRFDKDKDSKISADEAKEFKAKMLEKTKTIINEVQDAGAKVEKAEQSAVEVKKMDQAELTESIEGITDLTTGKLDLQKGIEEFEKMQKQNTAFQQSVQAQVQAINAFGQSFQTFKQDQAGFNFFSYAAKKIFTDKIEKEQAALQQKLDDTKNEANKVLADLTTKKAILDKNGEAVKAAIAAERQRIIKERDEKLAEIAAAQGEQKQAIDEKKKKFGEIEDQQKKLEERKKGIEAKQANVAEIQRTWTQVKAEEQWENRKEDMTESTKDAEAELEAMDILLKEPTITPEAKEKVKIERDKIAERLQRGQLGIKLADERIESGKKVERQLSDEEQAAAREMNSVSSYLDGQLKPAKDSLQENIANLEELKLQYATEAGQVTEHYNKRVEEVDKISEGVNDYVFASAISRNKAIDTLKTSTESLSKITIESKSLWNPLNWGGSLLEGVGGVFMDVAKWIDGNTEGLLKDLSQRFKESTSTWGKIGYGLAYGLTQVGGAFAGFVSGGCELVGGVFHMAAHPLDSLNGLGTLLGMNVKEGKFLDGETFKAAWSGMGKAIIGYDQFAGEKQNYGGAVGKFAFNVASVFVGGGAGAGAKAADAANIARVAEINVALAKAGANVGKFEGVAAKLAALEKVDAALAKTTQSAARSAYVKTFAKTIVYESLPQFTKDAAKAGREAIGFGGKTLAVTKSLGGSAVKGVKAVGRSIKAAPRAIAGIYGTLLTAPAAVLKGAGRLAKRLPDGWKAFRGEGLMNSYRASKMAEAGQIITAESGQYAKARAKIAEIIEKDPELAQLAKDGEFGLAAAEGKARLKLMKEDPALAASYSKVEEASKQLTEHSKEIAESSLEALEKVKNNPELKYEVTEYQNLKTKVSEAKATYNQVGNANIKISKTEAKVQLKEAKKALKDFEENPNRMKYIKQHEEALAAEKNLQATLEQQQKLFQEYIGARNPELAALEAEIGEAAARHGDVPGGRPAIKDTPEVIKANYEEFIDAVKKGDAQKIEHARAEFGPSESNSLISKKLDAVEQITQETSISKQARAEAIKKYSDACKDKTNLYSGDLTEMRRQYIDALKKGDLETVELIKKQKINQPHLDALKGIELEYLANPNNFFETYMKHQDGLYNMYKEYNQAWAEGNSSKLSDIRQAHPDLIKAFDQLDLRHTVLDKNNAIAHDIAAARIKVDLIADQGFSPTTKASDAAEILSRRYNNDKLQLGVSNTAKEITTLELLDDAGKPANYKVRLEANGEVLLMADDLKPVKASKSAPDTNLDLELAKTKVKVLEENLAKAEYTEYQNLKQRKASADSALETINSKEHLPKLDRNKVKTAMNELSLEHLDMALENIGRSEKLSTAELLEVRAELIKSKKLDTLKSTGIADRQDFEKVIRDALRNKANSVKSTERAASAMAEVKAADKALAAFEGDATKLKAAQDYEKQMAGGPYRTPAEAQATVEKKPIATRLREADAAVEAAKVDLLAEQKALPNLKENLRLTEETWMKAKESGKYNDAAINNLKTKVDQAREAILTAESKISALEETLSTSRSEYRSALLLRGGEKVLEKITSPLRAKWVENLKNKLIALPGVPKDVVLGLASLLGQQPHLLTLKTFQQLNQGFGKAFRSYVSQLIAADTKSDVLLRLLAPITAEQLIIMTQLTKGRMPDSQEIANFSDLPMPQKLAALEEGWKKLEKSGAMASADFYNKHEQEYLKDTKTSLEKAVGQFEDQENLTPSKIRENLEIYFGTTTNSIGKTYEMSYEGITATIAKDGKRTYSGIEDWLADQPNRKLGKNTFSEIINEHSELTSNDLKKLNKDKTIDSVEDYKKNLSEQITNKLTKQLENRKISENLTTIKSTELSNGKPTFTAHLKDKNQISVEINDQWANASFNNIKTRKPEPTLNPPAAQPETQPTKEVPATDTIEQKIPAAPLHKDDPYG